MKHYLAIDMSTNIASFAVKSQQQLWTAEQIGAVSHAETCLGIIEQLLTQAGLTLADMTAIVVGRGPGSFTGLRVAAAVVKGLCFATEVPIYPVSNLALLAWEAQQIYPNMPVLAAMDARMRQVYWAWYPVVAQGIVTEHVGCMSELEIRCSEPWVLIGHQIHEYLPLLVNTQYLYAQLEMRPNAAAMITMVEQGLLQSVTAEALEPVYVRDQVTHGGNRG